MPNGTVEYFEDAGQIKHFKKFWKYVCCMYASMVQYTSILLINRPNCYPSLIKASFCSQNPYFSDFLLLIYSRYDNVEGFFLDRFLRFKSALKVVAIFAHSIGFSKQHGIWWCIHRSSDWGGCSTPLKPPPPPHLQQCNSNNRSLTLPSTAKMAAAVNSTKLFVARLPWLTCRGKFSEIIITYSDQCFRKMCQWKVIDFWRLLSFN